MIMISVHPSGVRILVAAALFLVFTACVTQQPEQIQQEREVITVPVQIERDLPNTIDIPSGYQDAIRRGTRTLSGTPGPDYWQQYATYDIHARLHPDTESFRDLQR
jgi:hypothetical protein